MLEKLIEKTQDSGLRKNVLYFMKEGQPTDGIKAKVTNHYV